MHPPRPPSRPYRPKRRLTHWLSALTAPLIGLLLSFAPAQAQSVDTLLVLCMDASGSIDAAEFELQRRGYAEALTDSRILEAIRAKLVREISGRDGPTRIAVRQAAR